MGFVHTILNMASPVHLSGMTLMVNLLGKLDVLVIKSDYFLNFISVACEHNSSTFASINMCMPV